LATPVAMITPEEMIRTPGPEAKILRDAGFDVRYPADTTFTRGLGGEEDSIRVLAGVNAVIAGGEYLTPKVFAALPELRVVARAGVGFDRVDIPAATKHRVVVTITATANHAAVAEHTLALLFGVARSVALNDRVLRSGKWIRRTLRPVRGQTIGLIGLGRIGRSTASRCVALGMKVLAYELYPDQEFVKKHGIELVDFETLLKRSDFVSIHCPLNDQTRGLMNAAAFALMKPGSVFINTARGGLVVESALIAALQSGHLGGAGLDVFEQEPTDPGNPLFKMDNVVVCPHLGGGDTQSIADMGAEAAQSIVTLYRGQWPPDAAVLNGSIKEGWRWQR
jgi:D-3-phosphoglycerate dehydrogenase / 2-oxoglutarate reductase